VSRGGHSRGHGGQSRGLGWGLGRGLSRGERRGTRGFSVEKQILNRRRALHSLDANNSPVAGEVAYKLNSGVARFGRAEIRSHRHVEVRNWHPAFRFQHLDTGISNSIRGVQDLNTADEAANLCVNAKLANRVLTLPAGF
jgi:hypothetical protein